MTRSRFLACAALTIAILPSSAFAQTVTKVPSGDTVVISGVGKIRLLGIRSADEPALRIGHGTVPPPQPRKDPGVPATPAVSGGISLSRERPSRTFLQQLVLGREVRIQYDTLVPDKKDRRAYVFLQDGTLVNAEMLRRGKARVDLSYQFAHEAEFKRLEEEARSAEVGIWLQQIR